MEVSEHPSIVLFEKYDLQDLRASTRRAYRTDVLLFLQFLAQSMVGSLDQNRERDHWECLLREDLPLSM